MENKELPEGSIIRQGDVYLVKKSFKKDKPAEPQREDGKVILAYGEVTGHHHRIEGAKALDFGLDDEGNRLIRVQEEAPLIHEEHSAPTIIGDYYVHIQQEWQDEPIQVRD